MTRFAVRLAIGALGIGALFAFGALDFNLLLRAADNLPLLAVAFLLLLCTVPIASFRWWMLLRGLNLNLSIGWAFTVTFISLFFHTFLPGAYGGDVVRVAMGYRALGRSLNRLTFSVVVDRLSGLLALLLLGVAVIPVLPNELGSRMGWIAILFVLAGVVGVIVVLRFSPWVILLVNRLPARLARPLARIVGEVSAALGEYVAQPAIVAVAVLVSVLQYVLVVGALAVLGQAMHFESIALSTYTIAGVWALVANALPISPGGLGVGEAAFAQLTAALSSSSEAGYATIFLGMRVTNLLIGAIGVLPFLLYRRQIPDNVSALANQPRREGAE